MNRTVKNTNRPHPKPVTKIELKNDKYNTLRLFAAFVFLVIGAGALAYAVHSYLSGSAGWTKIEAKAASERNCSEDFVFLYNVGSDGQSASAETRALQLLYGDAAVNAYQQFTNDEEIEGVTNIRSINEHPNETLTVDPVLYEALRKVAESGTRHMYLAPVYETYDGIFYCADPALSSDFDPALNEDLAEEYQVLARFAADETSVDLKLYGDNRVMLYVSEEYLAYANEEKIESFIDFYWMKNAFITDYIADVMIENGYTAGAISSLDGFVRNLDTNETSFSYNLYDKDGTTVYPAGVMEYDTALSIVSLRAYPASESDSSRYFEGSDGAIRTMYLDIADGVSRCAVNELTSYSASLGCAELLLRMIPIYIAEEFNEAALWELRADDIFFIYGKDRCLYYNDEALLIGNLYEDDAVTYTSELLMEQ